MIRNENQLTSLPFYTASQYQDKNKWWVETLYRLTSQNDRYLPFQICKENITGTPAGGCPSVPSSVIYTADWSADVDDWCFSVDTDTNDFDISHDTSRLKIIATSPAFGAKITLYRKIDADTFRYVNSNVVANLTSNNSVLIYAYNFISCTESDGTGGDDINGGHTISRNCTVTTTDDVLSITLYFNTTATTTVYIEDFTITSVPDLAYDTTEEYDSDFSSSVDGWENHSGASSISYSGNKLIVQSSGIEFTIKNDTMIDVSSTSGVLKYMFQIQADIGFIDTVSIEGTRLDDTPFTRTHSGVYGTMAWWFDWIEGNTFIRLFESVDNIKTIDTIYIKIGLSSPEIQFDKIKFTYIEACAEPSDYLTAAHLMNAVDDTVISDVLTYMNANLSGYDFTDYQVLVYDASVALAANLDPGDYYLRLNDGYEIFYSEVFSPCSDPSEYIKIEWWRDTDIILTNGRIVYSGGFINTIYLEGDIGKPTYDYAINEGTRSLYKFKKKVVSKKRFHFGLIIPEVILDLIARLPNYEYITITADGITYTVIDIEIKDPKWEDEGDLAIVEIEFDTDTIMTTITGTTSSVNQLLADEETAINIRGNNRRIYQLSDYSTLDDIYIAGDKNGNTEAVRIPLHALTGLRSDTTLLLPIGEQTITFILPMSSTDYNLIITGKDSNGFMIPVREGIKNQANFTVHLTQPTIVTYIAREL